MLEKGERLVQRNQNVDKETLEEKVLFGSLEGFFDGTPTTITLPPDYVEYLSGRVDMPTDDFEFIDDLLYRYGVVGKTNAQEKAQPFGRPQFSAATEELLSYTEELRHTLDNRYNSLYDPEIDTNTLDGSMQLALYAMAERGRNSSGRIQELCYLFLHVPRVRKVHLQIHAEKMATALPVFSESLQASDQSISTCDDYFTEVQKHMVDSMIAVTDENSPETINHAIVMGYATHGYKMPASILGKHFAGAGVPNFISYIRELTNEALTEGHDVRSRVRSDITRNDGVGYRQMRISGRDAGEYFKDSHLKRVSLPVARQVLAENEFYPGSCPANLNIPATDGTPSRRPIALEYAMTILNHVPPHLLEK